MTERATFKPKYMKRWLHSLLRIHVALFLATAVTASAQVTRLLGLDISAWQGNISHTTWNNVRTNENRHFIILRSSRGGTTGFYNQNDSDNSDGLNTLSQRYDDPYYVQNINLVAAAGMYAGSYHFSRPDIIATTTNSAGIPNSGTDEADHFIQMAGPWMRPGYLVPVHDLEAGDGIRTDNDMAQFTIDFSERVYAVMGIRPAIYINGNYAAFILGGASASLRDQLAQPSTNPPTPVSPAAPQLWSARWPNQADPNSIDVQNGEPKDTYAAIYGPWDDYGTTHPWTFWQYASTLNLPSWGGGAVDLDADVLRGGIEFLKDQLVPAVWMNNTSGDWSTLTNWNSGQTPIAPVQGPGQVARVGTLTMPTPRLPGAAGSGTTSGQHDTVILERPNTNITVTLSAGSHNIRKLYQRETLNITGGSLVVLFAPFPDSTTNGAQFSGPVTLSGSALLSVHTLQVDAAQTFTLNGGTVMLNTIALMPGTTPAKLLVGGSVGFSPLTNSASVIASGSGAGAKGFIDLTGGTRVIGISDGTSEVDLSVNVAITNGALTKAGLGTMSLNAANSYSGGTTVTTGRLLVNNTTNSGTGAGSVTVSVGGILGGTGTIAGAVTVSNTGTIAPGTASTFGKLTLGSAPVFSGTNFTRINRNGGSPLFDQLALSSSTLTYGGTLVVSNAGAALTGGEVFTNFSAGSYSGVFANTILPALSTELNWNLNRLSIDGTLRVNRAPTANSDSYNVSPGIGLIIPIADLTTNDNDADGDTVALAGITLTSTNGIVIATNATQIFYNNNSAGSDRIHYQITDGNGGVSTGAVLITIGGAGTPPSISQQPTNLVVILGQPAAFSAIASGSTPLAYQWRFLRANIGGATNSTYSLANSLTNNAGDYTVVVTNSLGSITSSVAALTVNCSLTTPVNGAGTVTPTPNPEGYSPGTSVLLTATPNTGHAFTGWSGDASGSNNPVNIVMLTNRAITATFVNTNTDIFLDNTNSEVAYSGAWSTGTSSLDKYLSDYRFANTAAGGTLTATYRPSIGNDGYYDVYIWYPQGPNRATNAPWSVVFSGSSTNVAVDQTINGGAWRLIAAAKPFATGTNGYVRLSNDTGFSGKVVMADGVRLTYVGPLNSAPSISTQPQPQIVKLGSNVLFSVTASGTPTPGYQWQFNGSPISGATSSIYIRSNAQFADAGNYSVLVTNIAGSPGSSNAALTVLPLAPMWFQAITPLPDGRMTLVVTGEPGYAYSVDYSTNLAMWQQITNLMNTNGTSSFTDHSATNSDAGFYRARQ